MNKEKEVNHQLSKMINAKLKLLIHHLPRGNNSQETQVKMILLELQVL